MVTVALEIVGTDDFKWTYSTRIRGGRKPGTATEAAHYAVEEVVRNAVLSEETPLCLKLSYLIPPEIWQAKGMADADAEEDLPVTYKLLEDKSEDLRDYLRAPFSSEHNSSAETDAEPESVPNRVYILYA